MKAINPECRENFIRFYDDAVDQALCGQVITLFDQDDDKFKGAVAGNEGNVEIAEKQTEELIIEKPGWEPLVDKLKSSLFKHIEIYTQETKFMAGSDHRELRAETLRLKKYDAGGRFDWHIDNNCKRNFQRVLAAQWYFNTVEEGGHTEFEDQKVSVAPVAGRLVFFPVAWMYRHRGAPPLSGPKYICTTFISPIF